MVTNGILLLMIVISFVSIFLPKLLQLLGLIGWTWVVYQFYINPRFREHIHNSFRATLMVLLGILLELFFQNVYLL